MLFYLVAASADIGPTKIDTSRTALITSLHPPMIAGVALDSKRLQVVVLDLVS